MKTVFIAVILGALVVIAGLAGFFILQCEDDWCFVFEWQKISAADSFERCANLGFPVAESYPRQCHAGGKSFVEIIQPNVILADYKNIAYLIGGKQVTLVDGRAEADIDPGSASKMITKYFGNDATGDLNGDGVPDIAFILTQYGGGSGTFYYVAVALKTEQGYQGVNAILLGDRVAPQTTRIKDGELIVNYADRKPDEPMAAQPSVGVSKYFKVSGGKLGEILIRVVAPLSNALVKSSLVIKGEARGYWYFEASFPVRLLDANGKELAVIPAQAKSEWMTTEFVPFEAVLVFAPPTTETGTLVLEKDNPSGLPEHADSISIPVRF